MKTTPADSNACGRLAALPHGVKWLLTAFLALVGFGYLTALANIYYTHHMADGRAGLSLDDLRAVYSGLDVSRSMRDEIPSRMLTMLRGAMRQYVDDESDFQSLGGWLKSGAPRSAFSTGESRRSPERVIVRHCLRCHAQGTGTDISAKAPFGPDELTADYAMLQPLISAPVDGGAGRVHLPPQYTMPRLVLISHIHMLSIPLFVLTVGLLFSAVRLPARLREFLTPLPMIALIFDFGGWWLSRHLGAMVYVVAGAGALFGIVFGIQIIVVAVDLWRPDRRIMSN